ncbi:response regulator [Aliikangiella sp. IMCC44359]|uniref:response regulator n=1 Tax=Aliikangiella sp. IMCC44359 TaxID=3459125 RepID=UPI00403B085B
MEKNTVNILLVEDNEVDVMDVKRTFKQAKVSNNIYVARDGIEALEKLRNDDVPSPRVVLMDINMPRLDGIECLQEIRKDKKLRGTVVFILTTSSADNDKIRAYEQNVAGYIVKKESGNSFLEVVTMLDRYWSIVELPCS